jgi:hypothetical protein
MRLSRLFTMLVGCWLSTGCQHGPSLSAEQERRYGEMLKSGKVRTEFDPAASLTPDEQIKVLVLAERCGIKDPTAIAASLNPVTRGLELAVSSRDRIDGRNRSFDSVWIFKRDWRDGAGVPNGKWLGQFWCADDGPSTSLMRRYEFRGTPIEVQIFGDLSMELADEIVSRIDHRRMRFEFEGRGFADKDYFERRLSRLGDRLSPLIGSEDGEYTIWIGSSVSSDCFVFRIDGPDIVVTSQVNAVL